MRSAHFLVVVILAGGATHGAPAGVEVPAPEPPRKLTWQWTPDERIAMRIDPQASRERVRKHGEQQKGRAAALASSEGPLVDAFDGRTHPELFLPHEVFRHLVDVLHLAGPEVRTGVRSALLRDTKRHGLPPDFWERLEAISAVYAIDMGHWTDMGNAAPHASGAATQRVTEELEAKRIEVCRSGADALKEARHQFGRERFDRFLYEAIAKRMFHFADRLPDPQLLRQAEEGCR